MLHLSLVFYFRVTPCLPLLRVRVCACARVRVCACARVRVCACARVRVCASARVHVCAYAHTLNYRNISHMYDIWSMVDSLFERSYALVRTLEHVI